MKRIANVISVMMASIMLFLAIAISVMMASMLFLAIAISGVPDYPEPFEYYSGN